MNKLYLQNTKTMRGQINTKIFAGETAYTLTMGTTNLNKLTNEQKAIATNKNWNLA